ncbi:hypothetical protein JDV02_000739, partial [Purpureocillium takamizusanense]
MPAEGASGSQRARAAHVIAMVVTGRNSVIARVTSASSMTCWSIALVNTIVDVLADNYSRHLQAPDHPPFFGRPEYARCGGMQCAMHATFGSRAVRLRVESAAAALTTHHSRSPRKAWMPWLRAGELLHKTTILASSQAFRTSRQDAAQVLSHAVDLALHRHFKDDATGRRRRVGDVLHAARAAPEITGQRPTRFRPQAGARRARVPGDYARLIHRNFGAAAISMQAIHHAGA